jgi:hypothetical protein
MFILVLVPVAEEWDKMCATDVLAQIRQGIFFHDWRASLKNALCRFYASWRDRCSP